MTLIICDSCGDESNSDPGLVCGRDLSEELGQPDGTTICEGTYREVDVDKELAFAEGFDFPADDEAAQTWLARLRAAKGET